MADPEFRQGVGPDRLPQGAAGQLNAANRPIARSLPLELENTDIPVEFARGEEEPVPNDDGDVTEDMQVLLGPPEPAYKARIVPKDREGRLPRYVVRHLPQLMAAAKNPTAHPTLRAFYMSVVRNLQTEMRRGGR